jgi:hypothetical protein
MSVSMHITGGDLPGLKRLQERMKDANRTVLVGVPQGATAKKRIKHAGKPDEIVETDTNLAVIAAVHEFGSPEQGIPERSFLRAGVRAGVPKFNRLNEANLRAVVLGTKTVDQSINLLGVVAVGEVQRQIRHGQYEPLKQATIDRKGSSKPLIDTAQLIQSQTYVVEGQQSADAKVIE